MNYITGHDRQQIGFCSLLDAVGSINVLRFIDTFEGIIMSLS